MSQPSTTASLVDIWSHILTVTIFVLLFTLPPFRFRRAAAVAVAAVSAHVFTHLEPADPGLSSRLRYLTSSMWTAYMVWLALLLFHNPEDCFWRLGRTPREAAKMRFGWEKFKWAINLLTSWRGVGWNVQMQNLRRRELVGKWRFVVEELGAAVSYYVLLDITTTFLQRHILHHPGDTLEQLGWGHRIPLTAALGLTALAYADFQYAAWSALLVATGLFREEDFPPLFGDLMAATSLGNFWSIYWHQNLRNTLLDYGQHMARFLRVPRRSVSSWLIHVWTAFLVSGLMHSLPFYHIAVMGPPHTRLYGFASMMTFYLLQALGLTIEAAFQVSPGEDILLYEVGAEDVWLLGRLWTLGWLLFSGSFALDCWLRTETSATTVPYSLVAVILQHVGI